MGVQGGGNDSQLHLERPAQLQEARPDGGCGARSPASASPCVACWHLEHSNGRTILLAALRSFPSCAWACSNNDVVANGQPDGRGSKTDPV